MEKSFLKPPVQVLAERIRDAITIDFEYSELGGKLYYEMGREAGLSKDVLVADADTSLTKQWALANTQNKIFAYTSRRERLGIRRTALEADSKLFKK